MGLAQQFEKRLESLVEGVFSRGKAGIEPLELARKLRREMGEHRSVGLHGETLVPNHFRAELAPEDHDRFGEVEHALTAEIAAILRAHADEEGWALLGPVHVDLVPNPDIKRGRLRIMVGYKEAAGPTGGVLVLPDGSSVSLEGQRTLIGRLPDCEVVVTDPNVSRHHAEVRWDGQGYVISDLGSMNGTLVNDARVQEARLNTGDIITIGRTRLEVRLA